MTTGDPMMTCPRCQQTVYVHGWHNCNSYPGTFTTGCPDCGAFGAHFCPGPKRQQVVYTTTGTNNPITISHSWECHRCHQIWAYWVPKCDCKPEPEKCALCGKAEGDDVNGETVSLEYPIGWPSKHLDMERVCNLCVTSLVDADFERRNQKA